jgi:uncharacterized membrane protein
MQNPPPNYEPAPTPGGAMGTSSTGMDANVAALLCYILTWLTGLIFFLIEKESRFVRFHAMQAILLGAVLTIFWIVVGSILFSSFATWGLFSPIWLILRLGGLALVILCCVKAYQGQMFKLPIIGDMAERFSAK